MKQTAKVWCLVSGLAVMSLWAHATPSAPLAAEPGEAHSGGQATVFVTGANAFSMPSGNLSPLRKLDFSVGNSFFRNPWVSAPSSTDARDGLGPLFNTNACQNCHIKDGRGHPPADRDGNAVSMLVRLSVPAHRNADKPLLLQNGVVPEPVYGGQLQDMANPGVTPEGKVRFTYHTTRVKLADGMKVELQQPKLQITELGYGPMRPDVLTSVRIAPPMIGLGLLEAIPEESVLANADPDDSNDDGISGRPNQVWNKEKQATVLGRFGWKAGQPSLDQQNSGAFAGDMGLTSQHFGGDDCTSTQSDCRQAPTGGTPEVSDDIRAKVLFYSRNLGVPARRDVDTPAVQEGKVVFHALGCQQCHTPAFTTTASAAEPELANQDIHPYTDLLLHDMGEGLADRRPEFQATGNEWRTPPLWGIGLTQDVSDHTRFLHDGRARNLLEAILWHGGEARAVREAVVALPGVKREALLAFLNSL